MFSVFSLRKNLFMGKRLNIFDIKAFAEEAPETGLLRILFLKCRNVHSSKHVPGVLVA
jgi:hypothetical protein